MCNIFLYSSEMFSLIMLIKYFLEKNNTIFLELQDQRGWCYYFGKTEAPVGLKNKLHLQK